jgi:hypothetical protein
VSSRALALLIKAERRELERERLALTEAGAALDRAERNLEGQDHRFGEEASLALAMPDGPRLAAAFTAGHRHRLVRLRGERERLAADRAQAETAVRKRAVALGTLERAAEELAVREQAGLARAEQRRLDDAAVLRHAVRGRSELGSQGDFQAVERVAVLDLAGEA